MNTPPKTEGERLFRAWWSAAIELEYSSPNWARIHNYREGWRQEDGKEIWELAAKKLADKDFGPTD